jgi:hypothetical protein
MKTGVLGGAILAATAASLALSNAVPAQAKGKHHHAAKPAAEKHGCGGKNGCPSMNKGDKPAEAAAPEAKPADGK